MSTKLFMRVLLALTLVAARLDALTDGPFNIVFRGICLATILSVGERDGIIQQENVIPALCVVFDDPELASGEFDSIADELLSYGLVYPVDEGYKITCAGQETFRQLCNEYHVMRAILKRVRPYLTAQLEEEYVQTDEAVAMSTD